MHELHRETRLTPLGRRPATFLCSLLSLIAVLGCSRSTYRTRADQQVRAILEQKRCEEAYTLPPLPGVEIDPRSRLYDPSPPDCPSLPDPVPRLSGYELPSLATGDPSQTRSAEDDEPAGEDELLESEAVPSGNPVRDSETDMNLPGRETSPQLEPPQLEPLPAPAESMDQTIETVSHQSEL
ncbi:MAG: hypothetical protein AAF802_21210, partial [Planctomycetota bacterium]